MRQGRRYAAAAMFQDEPNIWWVTGGYNGVSALSSTEVYNATRNIFSYGVEMPMEMSYHNLVNVNNTHMVLLGGQYPGCDEVFIFDR